MMRGSFLRKIEQYIIYFYIGQKDSCYGADREPISF